MNEESTDKCALSLRVDLSGLCEFLQTLFVAPHVKDHFIRITRQASTRIKTLENLLTAQGELLAAKTSLIVELRAALREAQQGKALVGYRGEKEVEIPVGSVIQQFPTQLMFLFKDGSKLRIRPAMDANHLWLCVEETKA